MFKVYDKEIFKNKNIYQFSIGDLLSVYILIKEEGKQRIQIFEGICIKKRGSGMNKTFTLRRVNYKGHVERIFPYFNPSIQKIIVKQKHRVRKAKLYYLRKLFGKKARMQPLNTK